MNLDDFGDEPGEPVTPTVYWVVEQKMHELHIRLDKLVAKAMRLNVGAIAYNVGKPEERAYCVKYNESGSQDGGVRYVPYQPGHDRPEEVIYFRFYPVAVTGTTPRLAGWSFIATLQHLTDDTGKVINMLRVMPGVTDQLPEEYRTADASNCDHCCRSIRTRKDTFILRHDETGEYKQVGRNCIQDFLGGNDPHDVARYMEMLFSTLAAAEEASNDEVGEHSRSGEPLYQMTYFLTMTTAAIRVFGWVSRGKARDSGYTATADIVLEALSPAPPIDTRAREQWNELRAQIAPTEEDKATAEKALEYARDVLSNKLDKDDYEHNLYVATTQVVLGHRLAGITASLIPYYLRELTRRVEREQVAESHYFGVVGERIDLYVTVARVHTFDGQYGTTFVHKFVTREGNQATWFASNNPELMIGQEYFVTAGVKKHEEYQGIKQTILTRVSVWTEEGLREREEKAIKKAEREAKKAAKAAVLAAKAAAKAGMGWSDPEFYT